MKTIQFTGTEYEIENLEFALAQCDLDLKTETRVYVLNTDEINCDWNEFSNEEFVELAEKSGKVYSLSGFQEAFNLQEVNSAVDVIRFINQPIY